MLIWKIFISTRWQWTFHHHRLRLTTLTTPSTSHCRHSFLRHRGFVIEQEPRILRGKTKEHREEFLSLAIFWNTKLLIFGVIHKERSWVILQTLKPTLFLAILSTLLLIILFTLISCRQSWRSHRNSDRASLLGHVGWHDRIICCLPSRSHRSMLSNLMKPPSSILVVSSRLWWRHPTWPRRCCPIGWQEQITCYSPSRSQGRDPRLVH